ncbi:MAG: replication restart helicase PriA [Solirubrobacterales bacterium]
MRVAKVEPITTARALRGPFDYLLGERFAAAGPGSLLLIPFAGRKILGVVTALADSSELPASRLAEPLGLLEPGTTPELVELAGWIADRYVSTLSRGIALALPPGVGTGKIPRSPKPRVQRRARITDAGREALGSERRLGGRQRAALELLAKLGELAGPQLSAEAGADSGVMRRLAERGWVSQRQVEVRRTPLIESVGEVRPPPRLSTAQTEAVEAIAEVAARGGGERLLHGVTGSGKTEVYLAAIEDCLRRGRTAILLVPEIGLTPQTLGRVSARLGEDVAVLHSALSEGQRFDEWRRLRSGEARVCVGPRSAVFAPVSGLGLVVVDEEHDSSYKQEGDPRYDARAVARWRAARAGAVYLAGSATPRPETWAELERIELPERVDGIGMPPVELLDMREVSPRSGPLHPRVREALGELPADAKAIVMLNRRGYSPHVACGECGEALGCPHCDVSLVMHRASGRMACHHCGFTEAVPKACPSCGSVALARHGAGTEQLEAIVAELVRPAPVFRLDADTVAKQGGHGRVLAAFEEARGGVLLGTQMVAKGHDFADVVLSVLVDADSTLRYPDFRAEERTFALVSQLAGRSGRGERGGGVMIQTLAPEAAPIEAASRHDAPGFLEGELERRASFGYPPRAEIVAVELSGPTEAPLAAAAETLAASIATGLDQRSELLGPAPRFRRRGRFRRRILVKTTAAPAAREAVRAAVEAASTSRQLKDLALAVDVDPQ